MGGPAEGRPPIPSRNVCPRQGPVFPGLSVHIAWPLRSLCLDNMHFKMSTLWPFAPYGHCLKLPLPVSCEQEFVFVFVCASVYLCGNVNVCVCVCVGV